MGKTITSAGLRAGVAGGKDVIVDSDGCAVYMSAKDTRTATGCDLACELTWRPLPGPGQRAGPGVIQARLGTFTRPSGLRQVTLDGHQLYLFSGDKAPGQANGRKTNPTFFLVGVNGQPVP